METLDTGTGIVSAGEDLTFTLGKEESGRDRLNVH